MKSYLDLILISAKQQKSRGKWSCEKTDYELCAQGRITLAQIYGGKEL